MSQLWEHIEKHPSETTRLLGLDYDQFISIPVVLLMSVGCWLLTVSGKTEEWLSVDSILGPTMKRGFDRIDNYQKKTPS
jgi:hypothetical protein